MTSHTIRGDRQHSRDSVVATIVRGNIPVSNGVVHLISKPLVVVASPLDVYLRAEEESAGRLSRFARYLRKHGSDLLEMIKETKSGTIFAPTNEAFDVLPETEIEKILEDPVRGRTMLGLHFINQRIASDDIRIVHPQNKDKVILKSSK